MLTQTHMRTRSRAHTHVHIPRYPTWWLTEVGFFGKQPALDVESTTAVNPTRSVIWAFTLLCALGVGYVLGQRRQGSMLAGRKGYSTITDVSLPAAAPAASITPHQIQQLHI